MKSVCITSGVYGYRAPETQCITPVTEATGSIVLNDAEADRLVARGVARYVTDEMPCKAVATAVIGGDNNGLGVDPVGGKSPPSQTQAAIEKPVYNADSNANALRAIGKAIGISFKPGTTKVEMVQLLDKAYATTAPTGDVEPAAADTISATEQEPDADDAKSDTTDVLDDEEPPTLGAEAPVI